MLKKITFTLILITCVAVLPSYTNTCARPDANFLKSITYDEKAAPENQAVKNAGHGLEVFPLGLISIQL